MNALFDEVSWAYAGRNTSSTQRAAGRQASGPANLLSVNVDDLLTKHGLRGNWLQLCDEMA